MIISKVYVNEIYQGETAGTTWDISDYSFTFGEVFSWRIDTYDTVNEMTTTGDTWTFTVKETYPNYRPDDYDPVLIYATDGEDPDTLAWSDPYDFQLWQLAGGRYKKQLIALTGEGKIYYGRIE